MNNNLKGMREIRSLSQSDLSNISGVHVSTIIRLEKGTYKPRPQTVRKLAEALAVPVEELLDGNVSTRQNTNTDELKILLEQVLHVLSALHMSSTTEQDMVPQRGSGEAGEFYHSLLSSLSLRETEMLRLIAIGQSNQDIAIEMDISVHTVASYVKRIMQKLGMYSRTQAAACAFAFGLISRGEVGQGIMSRSGVPR